MLLNLNGCKKVYIKLFHVNIIPQGLTTIYFTIELKPLKNVFYCK